MWRARLGSAADSARFGSCTLGEDMGTGAEAKAPYSRGAATGLPMIGVCATACGSGAIAACGAQPRY